MKFEDFIQRKTQFSGGGGFAPSYLPDYLFPFQSFLVDWACRNGRSALFEDCGLGKTVQQLVWAENVARETNGRVLILTPLAVSAQTAKESERFGIECGRYRGKEMPKQKIVITNYEQLHKLDPKDFDGCVCDESSILKNFDGSMKSQIVQFMRKLRYRLLCTATASPNDWTELGTSSEALGYLGHIDMLKKFFRNENNTNAGGGRSHNMLGGKYRFRGHSETDFWRWVCSWARAVRKPSDLGFKEEGYKLPKLIESQHLVESDSKPDGFLFSVPAVGLKEQREERSRTVEDRCQIASEIATNHKGSSVLWCHLNRESEILKKLTPDSEEVKGSDKDERKEEIFQAFESGEIINIITKPSLACFGLNWQHCHHQTFFPTHSYEQYYQAVRRCWRFGQKKEVKVDIVCTNGELNILKSIKRKSKAADEMFARLVEMMMNQLNIKVEDYTPQSKATLPSFLA